MKRYEKTINEVQGSKQQQGFLKKLHVDVYICLASSNMDVKSSENSEKLKDFEFI